MRARRLPGTLSEMSRISFRSLPAGGAVLRAPRATPADLLLGDDELVLLVHGYANDEPAAFASYRRFMENLGERWAAKAAGVFWPGDGRTRDADAQQSLFSFLAVASYMWQPQRARETARHLADLLGRACVDRQAVAARRGRVARPLVVSIVAHSMGCRLTLELLNLVRTAILAGARLRVRSVGLMAAAVPAYHVQERGDLELAFATAERTTVYWSRSDRVLRFPFRFGQVAEFPFPLGWRRRGAIGRHGVEGLGARSVQVELDHSDYWPSVEVAEDVRDQLEPSVDLFKTRTPARRIAGARPLSSRRLGTR